jgi:hypothetical protein
MTTVAVACGGSGETPGSGGTGGTGGATSSTSASITSSSSSSASSSSSGGGTCPEDDATVFAVSKLLFGEGDSGEWKKFGFNLDDKISNGLSTDVCQVNSGGLSHTAYPDGDNGIDNSFGKNLLPTLLSLYPTWANDANLGILNGIFTALIRVACLPPTGDAPALTAKLFGATTLGMAPKWDGMDKWPIEPGLLSDPLDPLSSTITFDQASVTGSTFDAGKNVTFILSVPVMTMTETTSIKLTLHSAKLTMNLSADRKSATGGMIGGVLNTEEFVSEVKKVGALLDVCNQALFQNLITQIRQASDIMTDGTQDPGKVCDGISIGLGFEMSEALIGDVGMPNPVGDSCP